MAMKVVAVSFLALMLVFLGHNAMAQESEDLIMCQGLCAIRCRGKPRCLAKCLARCVQSESVDTTNEVETRDRVCNVGCSLGHCSKFLVQYDNEKFGACMTSCSENYCIGNALEKA